MNFCFYCGRIGHSDRACEIKKADVQGNIIRAGQYGDWLRGSFVSFSESRDYRYPNLSRTKLDSESSKAKESEPRVDSQGSFDVPEGGSLEGKRDSIYLSSHLIPQPPALMEVKVNQFSAESSLMRKKKTCVKINRSRFAETNSKLGEGHGNETEPSQEGAVLKRKEPEGDTDFTNSLVEEELLAVRDKLEEGWQKGWQQMEFQFKNHRLAAMLQNREGFDLPWLETEVVI
ncbi:zinc knuckle (CCHC-type) family protein [Striga asiatica]|uniref:Zinc knuckle (CCHC-type) family protein n=1 Tax=Striga asiatica TaxID=4170 RepID=A0A5A7RD75_STRAF|nr:zinc knuckle (CCHC-type) family protein [Striga asiatica]